MTNTTFAVGGDIEVRRLGFGAMRITGSPMASSRISPSPQVKLHASLGRTGTGLLKHRRGRVDADHPLASRLSYRDRDPPVPDRELDQRAARLSCELDVEDDIRTRRNPRWLPMCMRR